MERVCENNPGASDDRIQQMKESTKKLLERKTGDGAVGLMVKRVGQNLATKYDNYEKLALVSPCVPCDLHSVSNLR